MWSWIVFAGLAAVAITSLADDTPPGAAVPSTWGDAFLSVVTFDFGRSFVFDEPALPLVFERLGNTGVLLLETLVLVAVIGLGLALLARRSDRGRRATEVFGYVAALPVSAWLFGMLWVGQTTDVGLLQTPAAGPVEFVVPALALALPLAAFVARNVSHATADRDWILEGWLFVSWVLSTLLVVEQFFEIPGIGFYLLEFYTLRDPTGLVAALGVLTILALLVSLVREVAWDAPGVPSTLGRTADDGSRRADGGVSPPDPASVLRSNRRVQVGLGMFALLLVVGVLGGALYEPGIRDAGGSIIDSVLRWLDHVTVNAVVAAIVASVIGVVLGIATVRVAHGRNITTFLAGYAMNIPLLVWLLLVVEVDVLPIAPVMGFAVAPLVAMAAARDVERSGRVSPGVLLPAIGIAVTGAAVVALVSSHVLTPPLATGRLLETRADQLATSFLRDAIGIGAPVLSLFLLGSGLRSRWPTS